jgi:hypothetical protein
MNLTFTDGKNGGPVYATVSGSSAGTVNIFTRSILSSTDVLFGTRTGDGNYHDALPKGFYYGFAVEGDDVSNTTFFGVTDQNDSVHDRILRAAQAKLQSLELPGINNNSIRVRKLPIERDFVSQDKLYELPALLLSPMGQESMGVATNVRDDVAYPVVISLFTNQEFQKVQDLEGQIEPFLKTREKIARVFRNQRLMGVDEVWNATVEPAAIVSPDVFQRGLWASFLTVKFISREVRGV